MKITKLYQQDRYLKNWTARITSVRASDETPGQFTFHYTMPRCRMIERLYHNGMKIVFSSVNFPETAKILAQKKG